MSSLLTSLFYLLITPHHINNLKLKNKKNCSLSIFLSFMEGCTMTAYSHKLFYIIFTNCWYSKFLLVLIWAHHYITFLLINNPSPHQQFEAKICSLSIFLSFMEGCAMIAYSHKLFYIIFINCWFGKFLLDLIWAHYWYYFFTY